MMKTSEQGTHHLEGAQQTQGAAPEHLWPLGSSSTHRPRCQQVLKPWGTASLSFIAITWPHVWSLCDQCSPSAVAPYPKGDGNTRTEGSDSLAVVLFPDALLWSCSAVSCVGGGNLCASASTSFEVKGHIRLFSVVVNPCFKVVSDWLCAWIIWTGFITASWKDLPAGLGKHRAN